MKWWDQMPWSWFSECWALSQLFHSPLSLSSRGSLLLHFLPIRVVSSLYLRLSIFLPAILIPACASSNPAFLMMYSAYKLNKQGDNIQPCCTPFPIWNQSVVPRPVLTVASWSAYRFLKRQVRWSGIPISFRISHNFCFPVLCKFWQLYGGINGDLLQEVLCDTQVDCTQSPWLCSSPLLTRTWRNTQTQFCLSLCGVPGSWCAQSLFEPLSISGRNGVWF